MAATNPKSIRGPWKSGFTLDRHVLASDYIGDNQFGHPMFSTTRSELGELLYELKYGGGGASTVKKIAATAANFVKSHWKPPVDSIVAVPASRLRANQPVTLIGEATARQLNVEFGDGWIKRVKSVPQLKNVHGHEERLSLLKDAHKVDSRHTSGKKILLIDDLFRSGATMSAVTSDLYEQGDAHAVYALSITRARNR
jgi:competence protein ComFC